MASEFLVSVRRNMACWRAIVESTRMQVLVSRLRASVGGRRRCRQEMETVGRGNARRSGVPCARNPLGTLTSNIWVSLLSRELQQLRQCKYWCLAASGGWFGISGGCTISAGDTGRAQG